MGLDCGRFRGRDVLKWGWIVAAFGGLMGSDTKWASAYPMLDLYQLTF